MKTKRKISSINGDTLKFKVKVNRKIHKYNNKL